MFSLRQFRQPTHRLPDLLPWAALIDAGVVLQKDGLLQQTIAFRGPDLASSTPAELVSTTARLNNALRRFDSGWAVFVEAQRLASSAYPHSFWPNVASWIVDVERSADFQQAGARFESSYYLTFVWNPPSSTARRAQELFFEDPCSQKPNDRIVELIGEFKKQVAELVDILAGVFPEVRPLDDGETLTYLHSTISTNRHRIRRPDVPMYLDGVLPDLAFTPSEVPMLGDHYIPTCTVAAFPVSAYPGILDDLNQLAVEYRWVTRFIFLSKEEADAELQKYRKNWFQRQKGFVTLLKEQAMRYESVFVDGAATAKAADADQAIALLGEDAVAFGLFTATVTVWDRNLEKAHRKVQLVKQVIQGRGFAVKDETLNSREAWLGSHPGNVYANVRRPILHTINLGHLMPVSAVWAGAAESEHLRKVSGVGTPHICCSTSGDTPFRLNLAVQDVGHTLIVGPTGAGKSTLLGLLALQFQRYPRAKVVIFDKDRSARAATLAVGGAYYEPGNDRSPFAFQPLVRIDDRSERIWAAQFVLNLFEAQRRPLDPSAKARVSEVLGTLAAMPPEHRTLSVLVGLLGPDLGSVVRSYTVDPTVGRFGQTFDSDHDEFRLSSWMHIEMGHLMALGEEAVVPALDYLFHAVEKSFDGTPTLMILDECWLFLQHPVFARRLQGWLKTLRKKNVYVAMATQELDDVANSAILSTILSATPTKIFLPNEEALTPNVAALYASFGLTETEIQIIAQAQKKRDYYYRSTLGRRLFSLDLGPAALAFAGMSTPADQRTLDDLVATTPPARVAEAILRARGLTDAAARLAAAARGTAPYWS